VEKWDAAACVAKIGPSTFTANCDIANPDLVERLATGAPLAELDWETVYGSGPARSIVSAVLGSRASLIGAGI
jgi:hypothetical protein